MWRGGAEGGSGSGGQVWNLPLPALTCPYLPVREGVKGQVWNLPVRRGGEGVMDISLVQGSTTIVLNGTGAGVPLRAGRIDLSSPGSVVVECGLDGTAAQIAAFQGSVEKALGLGELYAGLPGEDWAYLFVTLPDATVWRTPVLSGICEARPGPGARSGGSQGLKIMLRVEPWFESTTITDCPLSNRFGSNITGGLNADNHMDGIHNNYVSIANTAVLGDVPAPAILTLLASPNGLEYFVGQAVTNGVSTFTGMAEGEGIYRHAFGSFAVVGDATCSNGNYGAYTWNGTGEADFAWNITGAQSQEWAGRVYRPIMRLRDLVGAAEKYFAWFRLRFEAWPGVDRLCDGEGVVMATDRKLIVFPPLVLPPWPKPPAGFGWEGFHPNFVVQAEGVGAHALNIDFVQFFPVEGWLRLYPVITNMTYTMIRYDCGSGQISRGTTAGVTHVPEGPGILLYPGVQQKIFVLAQNAAMDIATLHTVRVQYRQRKRVL